MDGSVTFAVAFVAGVLSFLSPCVLPLVPSYLGFITGMSYDDLRDGPSRRAILVPAIAFVAGFSFVFLLLGASATAKSQARIVAVLGATTASERVRHLKTLHVDPRELLVAAKSGVAARDTAKQVAAAVDGSEAAPP